MMLNERIFSCAMNVRANFILNECSKLCVVGVKYRSMYVRGKSDGCPFVIGFVAVGAWLVQVPVYVCSISMCAANCAP